MPGNTSLASMKVCCSCGADLSGQPRMKDSQKRYWCVPCGEADQRKKQITASHLPCVGCRKPFPKAKLHKHGEYFYCKACLKKRTAAETAAATHAASGHARGIASSSSSSAAATAGNSD